MAKGSILNIFDSVEFELKCLPLLDNGATLTKTHIVMEKYGDINIVPYESINNISLNSPVVIVKRCGHKSVFVKRIIKNLSLALLKLQGL